MIIVKCFPILQCLNDTIEGTYLVMFNDNLFTPPPPLNQCKHTVHGAPPKFSKVFLNMLLTA